MIVHTDVVLSNKELSFIIDMMWATDARICKQIANRHGVSDQELECHLQKCLGAALCGD